MAIDIAGAQLKILACASRSKNVPVLIWKIKKKGTTLKDFAYCILYIVSKQHYVLHFVWRNFITWAQVPWNIVFVSISMHMFY